jgi:hypothetical protein
LLCVSARMSYSAQACNQSAAGFGGVMFPYVALAKDKVWQPGPYEGVELMILHKHETTAGLVVLRKFKAGHTARSPRGERMALCAGRRVGGIWYDLHCWGAVLCPERHTSRSAHRAHRSDQPHNFRRTADRRVISLPTTNNSSWLRSKPSVFLQA